MVARTRRLGCLSSLGLLALPSIAQDVIHYKFDTGDGLRVLNYAPTNGPAWSEGLIRRTGTESAWSPGRYGTALRATSIRLSRAYVDTGWDGGFTGDFTIAMWILKRHDYEDTYLCGKRDAGPFVHAHNAGANHYFEVDDGSGAFRVATVADIATLAASRWVHVVFVVRGATAQFYVDGVAEPGVAVPGNFTWPRGQSNFAVGGRHEGNTSAYRIDEFRFLLRAAWPWDIASWARDVPAAHAPYGVGCHGTGDRGGWLGPAAGTGLPRVGNAAYALEVHGFPGSLFSVAVGSNRLRFAANDLPYDLGGLDPAWRGCQWWSSADVGFLGGVLDVSGRARVGLPVPDLASLEAVTAWSQAVQLHAPSSTLMLSNAFASSIGR